MRPRLPLRGLALATATLAASPALAQNATPPASGNFLDGLLRQQNLLSDIGGLRGMLAAHGITLNATDVEEVLGNVAGGIKTGFTYDALTTVTLQVDTGKAFGLQGGLFNLSVQQIRGRNLSPYYLGNLQTASGIEAQPTTRLWELWYQQSFADDAFDVKLGQQSIDQEFMGSQGAALFINTMMGWPLLPSDDLYAGGPAYPLSSLGVRLRAQPGRFTLLAGVFDDNPPGGPFNDDSQLRGTSRWGGNFSLRTGALFIGEIQYAVNQPAQGEMVQPGAPPLGLPGTYKLGFWYDTAGFPSPRYGTDGLSLADPASNGIPKTLHGNYSFYAVADQTLWQQKDGPKSLAVFARAMGAPGDRNLIDFSLNAGVTLKAPLPGRDDDTAGVGIGVGHVASAASGLVRDGNYYNAANAAVPAAETMLELTYQAQLAPWLIVQPDMQYVIRPGGGVADPNNPGRTLRNELVVGARTTITF
jgi:porin